MKIEEFNDGFMNQFIDSNKGNVPIHSVCLGGTHLKTYYFYHLNKSVSLGLYSKSDQPDVISNIFLNCIFLDCSNAGNYSWEIGTEFCISVRNRKDRFNHNMVKYILPYFEPDFSDFNKLMKKLQNYLIFL